MGQNVEWESRAAKVVELGACMTIMPSIEGLLDVSERADPD